VQSSQEHNESVKDMADIIRRKLVVASLNLPLGSTPQHVADLLWETVGVNVDPADITVQEKGLYSANAFVSIDETSICEFLNRNFETVELGQGTRGHVKFEVKKWKEEQNRPQQHRPVFTNYKVSFDLPGAKK
jgi:hypothetical protein